MGDGTGRVVRDSLTPMGLAPTPQLMATSCIGASVPVSFGGPHHVLLNDFGFHVNVNADTANVATNR
jgi:hypothetical protein